MASTRNLEQVGDCMLGLRTMFLHTQGKNTTDMDSCAAVHNKELWLLRNMQNLLSLCFRNNYI